MTNTQVEPVKLTLKNYMIDILHVYISEQLIIKSGFFIKFNIILV